MDSSRTPGQLRLRVDDHVATILIDAPRRHNALEADDVVAFRSHLDLIEAEESVRVLVVSGAGNATFCAGASLEQLESGEMTTALFETLTERLAVVRVPTICALNGSVYGGGAEVALCCDFRIGVLGSRLSVRAARLGICYPLGGLTRYVQRLGLSVSHRLLVAAEELGAEEMLRTGFLTQLVPPSGLRSATEELATRLVGHAPLAVQAMKRTLNQVAAGTVDRDELDALIEGCAASEDLREGLRAQRERRSPNFLGR
jgi:enoyl-CoA hydratase/carnithine racemase